MNARVTLEHFRELSHLFRIRGIRLTVKLSPDVSSVSNCNVFLLTQRVGGAKT